MKTTIHPLIGGLAFASALFLTLQPSTTRAQGTAFTYQGFLQEGGAPASGLYDLRFTIYDAASGGSAVSGMLDREDTGLTNGLFTVTLDFGAGVFTGAARWLEIGVRPGASTGAFTNLVPRQPITATPYAIVAGTLTGVLSSASLSGTYSGAVTFNNAANSFSGSGAGLTGLNASQLTTGTVPAAALGNAWKISGNAGTTPGTHFLGTTDNQPLEIRVNNQRALRLEAAPETPNVVGGVSANSVTPGVKGATIAGGGLVPFPNQVTADFATVGGGTFHIAGGAWSTVAGGRDNRAYSESAAVAGGWANNISSNSLAAFVGGGYLNQVLNNSRVATISGGEQNVAAAREATVSGGAFNQALGFSSTIGGGGGNFTAGDWSTIAGGLNNTNRTDTFYSSIAGGNANLIGAQVISATIGGGDRNVISNKADYTTIGGGAYNKILNDALGSVIAGGSGNVVEAFSPLATIGGGVDNTVASSSATVGGGERNAIKAGAAYACISGGVANTNSAASAVIGGGFNNTIATNAAFAVIAGGIANDIGTNALYSFIGGGNNNNIALGSWYAAIAGGYLNDIGSDVSFGFIGGGVDNNIATGSWYAVIAGGSGNDIGANADFGFIGGGNNNNIATNSPGAVIAGGYFNDIGSNSLYCVVAGGLDNNIAPNSTNATIPGGHLNFATNYAFAAGRQAKANHTGALVWGDSTPANVTSTNANSVTMRAAGGYRLFSNSGLSAGVALTPGGGSWTSISDRHAKENFEAVNVLEVLEKVAALPLARWNYKSQDPAIRHIGPTAQDFRAAFGVGESDTGITTVDADGVALAAIQGLNQKLEDTRAELNRRDAENAELRRELAELKQLVQQLLK